MKLLTFLVISFSLISFSHARGKKLFDIGGDFIDSFAIGVIISKNITLHSDNKNEQPQILDYLKDSPAVLDDINEALARTKVNSLKGLKNLFVEEFPSGKVRLTYFKDESKSNGGIFHLRLSAKISCKKERTSRKNAVFEDLGSHGDRDTIENVFKKQYRELKSQEAVCVKKANEEREKREKVDKVRSELKQF